MNSNINFFSSVCLASTEYQAHLANLWQQLGDGSSSLDSKCWLEGRIRVPDSPIILVLADKEIDIQKIVKAILATPNSQYFVIFLQPLTDEFTSVMKVSSDYCCWPCNPIELAFRLQRLVLKQSRFTKPDKNNMENDVWENLNLIGQSTIFLDTLCLIKKASQCNAPILIEGETGCGKEVAARAIHYLGWRNAFPFIPMNCGAIPDQLIENELFGHEKGAYTDAKQDHPGLTIQADGGTLFLDEIEALSSRGQVTLLRFIEDHMVKPLGGIKSRKVDVRVIAASNVGLSELVAKGLFRQDLLFRLNLLQLKLPPLRQRKEDIQLLAEHFMHKYRGQYHQPQKYFHPNLIAWMYEYNWPGNIRELENFVHRSFLLSTEPEINHRVSDLDHQPLLSRRKLFERRQAFKFDASYHEAKDLVIDHFEQHYLHWLIAKANGNVTQAAEMAQKERRALGKLLKKHKIIPTHYRTDRRC